MGWFRWAGLRQAERGLKGLIQCNAPAALMSPAQPWMLNVLVAAASDTAGLGQSPLCQEARFNQSATLLGRRGRRSPERRAHGREGTTDLIVSQVINHSLQRFFLGRIMTTTHEGLGLQERAALLRFLHQLHAPPPSLQSSRQEPTPQVARKFSAPLAFHIHVGKRRQCRP